jgi:glycosyltransferase involved in cell wall biosynthesis
MSSPLVSVIVPVCNGERYLGYALQSILDQDYRPLEVIVVDDGSVDSTAPVARSFEDVRYVYQANQGHGAAMNTGIGLAEGEFLAFLDADDLWVPHKLSIQVRYMIEHPETDYVLAQMRNFLEPGTAPPPRITRDLILADYPALQVGVLLARRAVFDTVGLFDNGYAHAKDVDWFVRATEAGARMAILPQVLLHRRLHGSNRSYLSGPRTTEFLVAVKKHIDRHRLDAQKAHGGQDVRTNTTRQEPDRRR